MTAINPLLNLYDRIPGEYMTEFYQWLDQFDDAAGKHLFDEVELSMSLGAPFGQATLLSERVSEFLKRVPPEEYLETII